MTDPTPQPGADPGLPHDKALSLRLFELSAEAHKLHSLAVALELAHEGSPSPQDDTPEHQRRAYGAAYTLITVLQDLAKSLSDDLAALS